MQESVKNRCISVLFAIVLLAGIFIVHVGSGKTAKAAELPDAGWQTCDVYEGTNVEAQNYQKWSSPVRSYLTVCADGRLMRVQDGASDEGILVEYYDAGDYRLLSSKIIPKELPIFGGFYAADQYYFLLTGQENMSESPETEVFRITQYDKDWNRIKDAGLSDCNTVVPFSAGSARMDAAGNNLVIRTSHKMYKSKDGNNHQANVTIMVGMENMAIKDFYTSVGNVTTGYVSHSFNQFVKIDNSIVAVDHGDAYPRSILLMKYQKNILQEETFGSHAVSIEILKFPGAVGNNATGASVGGFELSASSYLVAGNSVVQDDSNLGRKTRNVFVAAVDRNFYNNLSGTTDTNDVTMNWLTDYNEGDGTTSTPQMVKISDGRYLVLWSRENKVYYTEINGRGEKTGETYEFSGSLSDCVPVVVKDRLVWYTWNNETVTFYEISRNDLSRNQTKVFENGHEYEIIKETADGGFSIKCSICGQAKQQLETTMEVSHSFGTVGGIVLPEGWRWQEADRGKVLAAGETITAAAQYAGTETGSDGLAPLQITIKVDAHKGGIADCTKAAVCEICGKPYGSKNPQNHTGATFTSGEKGATCTSRGYTGDTYCQSCKAKIASGRETDMLWHTYEIQKAADGSYSIKCRICGQVKQVLQLETAMEVSHNLGTVGEVVLPKGWKWQEADQGKVLTAGETITAAAEYTGTEISSGGQSSVQITIKADAHKGGTADCTKAAVCEICGKPYGSKNPQNHTGGTFVSGEREATCTEKGYTGDTYCQSCKVRISSGKETDMLGHKYVDDVCIRCQDKKEPAAKALAKGAVIVEEASKAVYRVTKSGETGGKVEFVRPEADVSVSVVPDTVTIDGITYKVTGVAKNAFKNNKKITKVTIGKNVLTIGKNAFRGCTRLKTAVFGSKVSAIGDCAFYKCTSLAKITIPAGVSRIGKQAFYGDQRLITVAVKTKKLTDKTVGKQAFGSIHAEVKVKVPSAKLAAYRKLLMRKGINGKKQRIVK